MSIRNKHIKLYYGDFVLTITETSIGIAIDGYGTRDCPGGDVIYLETEVEKRITSSPTLYVWGDVNQEEPTHRISVCDAHESLYEELDEEED